MKKKVIFISIFVVAVVGFLFTRINRENLDFISKYRSIKSSVLDNKKGTYVIYIFNSMCPGTETEFPTLKVQLDSLKKLNIPYYLIADELYKEGLDDDLDALVQKYGLQNEKIYLFDKNEFPVNGGVFNSTKRYKDFLFQVTERTDVPDGYVNHLIMKDGKLISFSPVMEFDKIP
jgi:hypothetical protein